MCSCSFLLFIFLVLTVSCPVCDFGSVFHSWHGDGAGFAGEPFTGALVICVLVRCSLVHWLLVSCCTGCCSLVSCSPVCCSLVHWLLVHWLLFVGQLFTNALVTGALLVDGTQRASEYEGEEWREVGGANLPPTHGSVWRDLKSLEVLKGPSSC